MLSGTEVSLVGCGCASRKLLEIVTLLCSMWTAVIFVQECSLQIVLRSGETPWTLIFSYVSKMSWACVIVHIGKLLGTSSCYCFDCHPHGIHHFLCWVCACLIYQSKKIQRITTHPLTPTFPITCSVEPPGIDGFAEKYSNWIETNSSVFLTLRWTRTIKSS